MAGSLNKVTLIGNIGRDPETRFTQDGGKIVNFSIATSESWKDRITGERRDKTEWHKIVVFNDRLADVVEKYVKKGSRVYIEGQLQTRKWIDNNGVDRYSTEIILGRFNGELLLLDNRNESRSGQFSDDSSSSSASSSSVYSKESYEGAKKAPLFEEIYGSSASTSPLSSSKDEEKTSSFLNDQIPF